MSETHRGAQTSPHDPVSWPQEIRLLRGLGLRDGLRVLDLGCGPGYVTAALARALPSARILAVDNDHELGRLAAELLAPARVRVQVVTAAADALPLPDGQFDVVIARYLFQHLDRPDAIAREVHRVLRSGGRCLIIDIDAALWGVAEPPFPGAPLDRSHDTSGAGTRLIARRLPRILRAAGFVDVALDAFAYDSDDLGIAAFAPLMTPQNYEAFAAAPDPFVMMIGFICGGVRS